MISDWLARTPLGVVAKNLGVDAALLGGIPQKDPYIYRASVPPPQTAAEEAVRSPAGTIPTPYVFDIGTQNRTVAAGGGGWVKVQDSVTNFPVATELASALVFVEPNGMRELHWHNADGAHFVFAVLCNRLLRPLHSCRMAVHHQRTRARDCVRWLQHRADVRFPGMVSQSCIF